MSDASRSDSVGRFTDRADLYQRFRPSYPAAALDFIQARCGLTPGSSVADIGCGTGISTRLLAARGFSVIGVEPNDEMRRFAEDEPAAPGEDSPTYRSGKAEATGLQTGSFDAVVAAQSFHWFEPEATLREFTRILKPGGWVILMWNEHDERDPFTAAFSLLMHAAEEATTIQRSRKEGGEPLMQSPLFRESRCDKFANEQILDEEELLGRAFSASYAPRQEPAASEFAAALRQQFAIFQKADRASLKYETLVYTGQQPGMRDEG